MKFYRSRIMTEHRANIACFVKNTENGKVYGITNRHVTLHSNEDVRIKAGKGQVENLVLGRPVNLFNELGQDIGLVEINDGLKDRVYNRFTDPLGHRREARLFSGDISDLFGKKVCLCKATSQSYESRYSCGFVLSKEKHQDIFGEVMTQYQFCVDGRFSEPGDSGCVVAIDTLTDDWTKCGKSPDSAIIIVGIVCGGSNVLTQCLFLPKALEHVQTELGGNLEFCFSNITEDESLFEKDNSPITIERDLDQDKIIIECSVQIFFHLKTPERIAPYSFDLGDKALTYTVCRFEEFKSEHFEQLLAIEQELKRLVNLRVSLERYPVFENDNPEYKTAEESLKAVELLHNGDFRECETSLKIALSCIPKCEFLALRLFAKLYTYIAWYFSLMNTTKSRRIIKIILEGLEFYDDNAHLEGFPKEIGGHLLYEHSRYYIQKYDHRRQSIARDQEYEMLLRQKSVDKARLAVATMEDVHREAKTHLSLVRQSVMQCELAFALLGCGNTFVVELESNDHDCSDIKLDDIVEADTIMTWVRGAVVDTHLLQNHAMKYAIYLITLCDLCYRKGDFMSAFKVAKKCLKVSTENNDGMAIYRSKRRIQTLQRLI